MRTPNRLRRYLCILVSLIFVTVFMVAVPEARAGVGDLTFRWYEPGSVDLGDGQYKVNSTVTPSSGIHFKWNFSNGLDKPLTDSANPLLNQVTLKKNGQAVSLNKNVKGQEVQQNDGSSVWYAGDFRYTKKGGGDGKGGELRLLELTIPKNLLAPGTTYVIEFGANFRANNGNTLGKAYSWQFTTAGAEPVAPKPDAPVSSSAGTSSQTTGTSEPAEPAEEPIAEPDERDEQTADQQVDKQVDEKDAVSAMPEKTTTAEKADNIPLSPDVVQGVAALLIVVTGAVGVWWRRRTP